MRKREELNNPDSCFNRAADNEMLFICMTRDVAAPAAIRAWVIERIRLGKNQWDDAQIADALRCADTMDMERPQTKENNHVASNEVPSTAGQLPRQSSGRRNNVEPRNGRAKITNTNAR